MSHPFDAISPDSLRAAGWLKWETPGKVGAWLAEMDFGTAPAVSRALADAVAAGAFGYASAAQAMALTSSAAAWLAEQQGWMVAPERIHPITDGLSAMDIAIQRFSAPGSPVVLPTPAYMPFLTRPQLSSRQIVTVPMIDSGGLRQTFDLGALERALTGGGLLVLCNPHNPTGRVYTRAELTALAEVVARTGARVLSDEIHAPFVYPGATFTPYATVSDAAASHAVTVTSTAKAWNIPGVKCALLIASNDADQATCERWQVSEQNAPSTLGVIASTAAYSEGQPWLDDVVAYLDDSRRLLRDLLAEHLPECRADMPEGTYLAWLDFSGLELGEPAATFFGREADVRTTTGSACGGTDACVRFTFAMPRPVLRDTIAAMGKAARRLGDSRR